MIEAVKKELRVPAAPADAFRRFTDGIDGWWPKETHSVGLERCARVRFREEGGTRLLLEETADGEEHLWGTVSAWEPGARLVFSWHPGREPATAQEVEVRFEADGEGTRVLLEHRGWEALGAEAAETRAGYDQGWNPVLGRYTAAFAAPAGREP